jgi:hypothetical protein
VYRYVGDDLGGRPSDPALLTDGVPDYAKLAVDPRLLEALSNVVAAAATRRVVLLCSEGGPAECHRGRLLGRVLFNRFSVDVGHITADGLRSQLDLLPERDFGALLDSKSAALRSATVVWWPSGWCAKTRPSRSSTCNDPRSGASEVLGCELRAAAQATPPYLAYSPEHA